MRRIIRRREIVEDRLRYAGEPRGPGTVSVQTAAEWLADTGAGAGVGPAALLLTPTDDLETLAQQLHGVH